jgi:hypothetical protein
MTPHYTPAETTRSAADSRPAAIEGHTKVNVYHMTRSKRLRAPTRIGVKS